MKILYCSNEQLLPLLGGGSAGNLKLMERLVQRGHKVTVSTPLFIDPEPIEKEYSIRLKPFSPFYMHRTARFQVLRYSLYTFLFFFHLVHLLWQDEYDCILLRNCILAGPAHLAGWFFKVPVFISMTDILSGFLYESKYFPRWLTDKLVDYERFVARKADALTVVSNAMKEDILKGKPDPNHKIAITYDGVEDKIFSPTLVDYVEVETIRKQLNLPGKIAMYHGIIDPYHGIQIMKQILEKALAETELCFLIIAKGVGYDVLRLQYTSERIRFLDFVPYERIPTYIAASDAGFIPYLPNFNLDKVLTLKLLEYLSMGKNVVSFNLRTIVEVFGKYGFMSTVENPAQFVTALVQATEKPDSDEAVKMIRDCLSWEKVNISICEHFEKAYESR